MRSVQWINGYVFSIIAIAVVLAAVFSIARCAKGQRAQVEPHLSLEIWPTPERHYQHAYEAGARAAVSLGALRAKGYATGRFWQTDASKVAGSPFNAENNMNNQVGYGGSLRGRWRGLSVGLAVHRTEWHVVWGRKNRHGYDDWFPDSGDWRVAERTCRSGGPCHSIAYHDQAGFVVGYDHSIRGAGLSVEVRWLPYRWKDLTAAPTPWRGRATFRSGRWRISAEAHRDLRGRWRGDLRARRRIAGRLWMTLRGGRFQPDHRRAFMRVAAGFVVQ
jgi:hypothetical protein